MRDAGFEIVLEAGDGARHAFGMINADANSEVSGNRARRRPVAGRDTRALNSGHRPVRTLHGEAPHPMREAAEQKRGGFLLLGHPRRGRVVRTSGSGAVEASSGRDRRSCRDRGEEDDLGAVLRGAAVLGSRRHDAALTGAEVLRPVPKGDRKVAAPDDRRLRRMGVAVPRPSPPPATRTSRTATPPRVVVLSGVPSAARRRNSAAKSRLSWPIRGSREGRAEDSTLIGRRRRATPPALWGGFQLAKPSVSRAGPASQASPPLSPIVAPYFTRPARSAAALT